jgi:hypothetical protein
METFTKLFGSLLVFVYHCFDRIVIRGYLSGLSRPEQVVYFFRQVVGAGVVDKTVFSQRTEVYRNWVEAYAGNHHFPIEWTEKGVRKENYVFPHLRRMVKKNAYGVMPEGLFRAISSEPLHEGGGRVGTSKPGSNSPGISTRRCPRVSRLPPQHRQPLF